MFLARFLKIDAIRSADDDLTVINLHDPTIQVEDKDLSIGHKTWQFFSQEEDFLMSLVKGSFLVV